MIVPGSAQSDALPALLGMMDARILAVAGARGSGSAQVLGALQRPRADPESPDPLLMRASEAFHLSQWEQDLFSLAVANELEPAYGPIWSWWSGAPCHRPTVGMALDLWQVGLGERSRALQAFAPSGALLRNALVTLAGTGPIVHREIGLSRGAARWALGETSTAEEGVIESASEPGVQFPATVRMQLDGLRVPLQGAVDPVVVITGPRGSGRQAVARAIASMLGLDVLAVRALPDEVTPEVLRRDCGWFRSLLCLTGPPRADLVRSLGGPVVVILDEDEGLKESLGGERPAFSVRTERYRAAEREAVWASALDGLDVDIRRLARQVRFGPGRIRAASNHARNQSPSPGLDQILRSCRSVSSVDFGGLAQRLRCEHRWEDLVVSVEVEREIKLALTWMRHGPTVFGDWGMHAHFPSGGGLTALFAGPPGTGKTLAARILAREVGMELYRVDLSQTVNKYIGETEKNLGRLFDEARDTNFMLMFDEAEAIFGRRTQVRDANDRYANLQTGYLLQRIEEHEGPVLLTSNMPQNLDEAFMRRLHVVAKFELPDRDARARIWRHHLPAPAHCADDLDLDLLATAEVSGAAIRNGIVTATLAAAACGGPLNMPHLVWGLSRELRKEGRIVEPGRFGAWARYAS